MTTGSCLWKAAIPYQFASMWKCLILYVGQFSAEETVRTMVLFKQNMYEYSSLLYEQFICKSNVISNPNDQALLFNGHFNARSAFKICASG